MIKELMKDTYFLSQKGVEATKEDLYVAVDLVDTLKSISDRCVGMAANMIGVNKRIIAINDQGTFKVLINPVVLKTSIATYDTQEGCMCHVGEKKVRRYESIKVEYFDMNFKKKIETFKGFSAQIVQHELDHLEGILI